MRDNEITVCPKAFGAQNSALPIFQTEMGQTSETGSQDFIPPDPAPPTQTPLQSSLPILPTNRISTSGGEAVSDFNTLQWDHNDVEFNSEPPSESYNCIVSNSS